MGARRAQQHDKTREKKMVSRGFSANRAARANDLMNFEKAGSGMPSLHAFGTLMWGRESNWPSSTGIASRGVQDGTFEEMRGLTPAFGGRFILRYISFALESHSSRFGLANNAAPSFPKVLRRPHHARSARTSASL